MEKIFSGLEEFGFKNLEEVDLYKIETKAEPENSTKEESKIDFLYDKSFTCPVCGNNFKSKAVKVGKARLVSKDTDLMPIYSNINPLLYDVVLCQKCGYASLSKYFDKIKHDQTLLVRATITPKFKSKLYPDIYDENIALERYKLSLLNSVVKKSKFSEKAYTCLKIAWIYRIIEDKENEVKFLEQALNGFREAFIKESFPICGMDTYTVIYLIGELFRRTGNNDEALKWFGKVIVTPNVNPRLKELARDQKDIIKQGAKH